MSTRTVLALLFIALTCSFLRGYMALGPAGVLWHSTELVPLSAGRPVEVTGAQTAGAEAAEPQGRVDLNSAPATELENLPGIGPALASRITEYRKALGGFTYLEQLLEVKGIGSAKLTQIRPLVVIGTDDEK